MTVVTPLPPFRDLSTAIGTLRVVVGIWAIRKHMSDALIGLLQQRLLSICARMERLAARFQAGKLWRVGVLGEPRVLDATKADGEVAPAATRIWPTRIGWLLRLGEWRVAVFGLYVQAILETPEMVALLMACPQAGRIMRPLCRMLAVETRLLRPRAVVDGEAFYARSAKEIRDALPPRPPKPRTPRPAVDWGRIPLPRGVLAAARRQGFGKLPKD